VQFGRYYEEFEVGAVYKHWPGKTVTEYDDHLFCLITMNHHPLHLDANYAVHHPAGQERRRRQLRLLAAARHVGGRRLGRAIANLEVESLKHVFPTFHGDTIYGQTEVLDKTESKSKDDRGVVHVETKGYNQDGVLVCIFRAQGDGPQAGLRRQDRRRVPGPSRAARRADSPTPRSRRGLTAHPRPPWTPPLLIIVACSSRPPSSPPRGFDRTARPGHAPAERPVERVVERPVEPVGRARRRASAASTDAPSALDQDGAQATVAA
jgi:acyl dehydratase